MEDWKVLVSKGFLLVCSGLALIGVVFFVVDVLRAFYARIKQGNQWRRGARFS